VSKVFGEALGSLYADKYGMEMFMIRIGNVNPAPIDKRRLAIWFSPRDLAQLVSIGIDHPGIRFEIVYGVSGNTRSWYDNSNAARLGYRPQDNAETYAAEVLARERPGDPRAEMYQGGVFVHVEEVPNPAAPRRERKMRIRVPAGATDTHMHIYDSAVPGAPDTFMPGHFPASDYRAVQKRLGLERVIVVQPNALRGRQHRHFGCHQENWKKRERRSRGQARRYGRRARAAHQRRHLRAAHHVMRTLARHGSDLRLTFRQPPRRRAGGRAERSRAPDQTSKRAAAWSVMMRSPQMPPLVSRSSSASVTPGLTTATPFALFPIFLMASKVTVLSSA